MTKTLLSIGHGFSAQFLTPLLLAQGWRVIGTTRSSDKAKTLAQAGVEPIIWPDADLSCAIAQATHLLISAAPNANGDPFLQQYTPNKADFEWVGYLSTTGVYGDHGGAWVDENTPTAPRTQRGKWRMAAEQAWQQTGLPVHIFRLAGIYGSNRGPFAKVAAGSARRIIKQGQVFSRIHVEDIAQVLRASINAPNAGAVYNLCDDDPAPPQDIIEYAAHLMGRPVPKSEDFDTAEMAPMARSFYSENKRINNARIKDELGVALKYPDYKTGLQALLKLEGCISSD